MYFFLPSRSLTLAISLFNSNYPLPTYNTNKLGKWYMLLKFFIKDETTEYIYKTCGVCMLLLYGGIKR